MIDTCDVHVLYADNCTLAKTRIYKDSRSKYKLQHSFTEVCNS